MRRSAIGVARRFGLGTALALALVVGLAPVPAGAAPQDDSCLITNEDDQRAQADVVFKGTLDATNSSATRDSNGVVHQSGLVHKFTPTSVYRGSVHNPQYVVEPPSDDKASAVPWEGPGPYLVFAQYPSDAEQAKYDLADTDLLLKPCGGTRPIDARDEPSFGPGTPVTSDDGATKAEDEPAQTKAVPADPEDGDPEFPLPGFRYLTDLLDGILAYLNQDDDDGTPLHQLVSQLNGDDNDGLLEQLLELLGLADDDDDSPLGGLLGDDDSPLDGLLDDDDGLLEQLLVLLGLREDDDEDGLVLLTPDTLLLIDPATLQSQLEELGLPDPSTLQEQLEKTGLPGGPGGDDGDTVSLLNLGDLGGLTGEDGTKPFDLGGLGGIGTPPGGAAPSRLS